MVSIHSCEFLVATRGRIFSTKKINNYLKKHARDKKLFKVKCHKLTTIPNGQETYSKSRENHHYSNVVTTDLEHLFLCLTGSKNMFKVVTMFENVIYKNVAFLFKNNSTKYINLLIF